MLKYTIKRLLQLIPMLLILSFIVFMIVRLVPGDPVTLMLGTDISQESYDYEMERLGLNEPLPVQYFKFLSGAIRGDLGMSLTTRHSVSSEIADRFPKTLLLALGGTIVGSLIGIIFGIVAAIKHNKLADNIVMVVSLVFVSTPSFFLALIMILVFCLYLGWFPSMGLKSWQSAVMPIMTLGLHAVGFITRTTRSAMLDVIHQDYIRTSRSRGIPEKVVIYAHALKNAMIPVLTAIGLRFGYLLAGAALVETVFTIPGIGRFVVDSVLSRDYPSIQGAVLVIAVTFSLVNTAVDLLYAWVDPRIKYE